MCSPRPKRHAILIICCENLVGTSRFWRIFTYALRICQAIVTGVLNSKHFKCLLNSGGRVEYLRLWILIVRWVARTSNTIQICSCTFCDEFVKILYGQYTHIWRLDDLNRLPRSNCAFQWSLNTYVLLHSSELLPCNMLSLSYIFKF